MKPELEFALKIISILISFAALAVAVGRFWAAIYPICLQRRNQRMLEDKFSRGPYDKATIERSTRYYIRPKCSNIDPAQEQELRHALIATREDLFDKVDYFLDHDDSRRHLLLLADSGTGKTSFVLNYYVHNARRPKRKRHRLALVPLGDKNADELIAHIPTQEDTVLFLDAFDEDTKAITDHHSRIRTLMETCRNFKRVVITCRTQFFPKEEEIPIETGVARFGPRKAGERGVYEFWKLYLSPFDDDDVDHYLKKRYPIWHRRLRKKARAVTSRIPLLTARPMLLAHIPDVIKSGAEIRYVYELYEVMIDAWLERETAWVDKEALREFSEQLAVNIYLNRETRGMERIAREKLPEVAKAWGIDLPAWKLTGRSLLNRDAEGNYKFAHRSIMEYLFVTRLVNGDERCCGIVLTDQMKRFLVEMLPIGLEASQSFLNLLLDVDLVAQHARPNAEVSFEETLRRLYYLSLHEIMELDSQPLPSYMVEVVQKGDRVRLMASYKGSLDWTTTLSTSYPPHGERLQLYFELISILIKTEQAISQDTYPALHFITRHRSDFRRIGEFSGCSLEPTSPVFGQFALKFVPYVL